MDERVEHPSHYCRDGAMECIDEMLMQFGARNTVVFCIMNAQKYRYRAFGKNGEEDIRKSDFYIKTAKELMDRYGIESELVLRGENEAEWISHGLEVTKSLENSKMTNCEKFFDDIIALADLAIWEKLQKISSELKAPKGQFNDYGGFKYRSCEDILEAVKPLLDKYGVLLILSDELIMLGDRYYIKATAKLEDGTAAIFNTAYAREDAVKKGMDGAQITGAASSYARKYALNGLFLIDDTKDADTNEYTAQTRTEGDSTTESGAVIRATAGQIKIMQTLPAARLDKLKAYYSVKTLAELTAAQANEIVKIINREQEAGK